jgi:phosphoribosyl 1,2-cyclic phosphodiesterase
MYVRFWGTRGSIAKPGLGTVRYGGNTSCVEVRSAAGTIVVVDCGTGIQGFGQALMRDAPHPMTGHILISHTHWDHIQGVPFFAPLFVPGNEWDIYAPRGLSQTLRDILAGQMEYTYFPITLDALGATIRYHDLVEGVVEVGDIIVRTQYLNHPALTLGYRLEVDGASLVYACDHEPFSQQLADGSKNIADQDQRHIDFLRDADLVIHDAQYTADEYASKIGWGHSTFEAAVDMCRLAGVKRLALTHHDPLRDDDGVDLIQEAARTRASETGAQLDVFAAKEGLETELSGVARQSAKADAPEFSAVTEIDAALLQHSILLGTTDVTLVKLVSDIAQAESIALHVEKDAASVLQYVESEKPSLVMLDAELVSAYEAEICRAIRSLNDTYACEVPIIAVAANERDINDVREHINDWLIKPFSNEFARTRIRAWLLRNTCRWIRPPLPEDEDHRLASLRQLSILDTEPEDRFDRITRLAASMFGVPIALVSLVDQDRQWFKSCYGLDATETSREVSFCAHAMLDKKVMLVPDALADPRFADNPLVTGAPRIRFYAGYPLTLPNKTRVGTLCLIDIRPRELSTRQVDILRDLGSMVEQELRVT